MVSFTNEQSEKLYGIGLNDDFEMGFESDKIDLSCYKSNDTLYHLLYDGGDCEFDNFDDMIKEMKKII